MPILAVTTQSKYNNYLRNHIRPEFEKWRMKSVDTQAIQLLINRCDLGSAATQDLRNVISAVFTHAKAIGLWTKPIRASASKSGGSPT
jgi:Phage integrase, N-terminal SAM-like domain